MRITNKQKELLAQKISKEVIRTLKLKSVVKNPYFIAYKKAKDKTDIAYRKYDQTRDVSDALHYDLGDKIFGHKEDYLSIDGDTGRVSISNYRLRDAIVDELHLVELSSSENLDEIVSQLVETFEVK
tara:strand:+ start:1224 stop:1604 length:381 start_codon:yes stop_codon:yes gene_type:complete